MIRFRWQKMNLPVVMAVMFGMGFAASVFLNVAQYQRAEQDKKLLQGEITDLRYQVHQDQLAQKNSAAKPTPTATPESTPATTPTPKPTSSPSVAGAQTEAKTAKAKSYVRIRAEASSTGSNTSQVKGSLNAGDVVTLGEGGNNLWQAVTTAKGVHGFVYKSYLIY